MKQSRASWCVAIGVTSAVHGGLLWAAVSAWSGPAERGVEPPVVSLVSIQGGLTDLEKGDAEPATRPEKPKPPEAETPPPAPKVTPVPTPAQARASQPAAIVAEPASAPAQSASSPPAPAPAPTTPVVRTSHPAAAQRAGEAAGLNVNAPRGKSQDYASMLRTWLEAHKTYPKHARMRREEGVVQIRFAVDRQGRLIEGVIVRSSGVTSLDKEALAMLDRSNPFPAAPHSVRGERIELQTPVEFYLR